MPRGSPQVSQGLPHCLQALQDMPLTNNPPGPCTTGLQANRMLQHLPATVVPLLYLALILLSPHPIFFHLAEPTTTSCLATLATLATLPIHTHTLTQPHSPHCPVQHHQLYHTPPCNTTQPNRVAIAQPECHEVLQQLFCFKSLT